MNEQSITIGSAILVGLTGIAAAIKWGMGRLAKSQDRGIMVLIKNAEGQATLTAKFDGLMSRFDNLAWRFDQIIATVVSGIKMDDAQRAKLAAKIGKTTSTRPTTRGDNGTE